jgi:hypothetical protein
MSSTAKPRHPFGGLLITILVLIDLALGVSGYLFLNRADAAYSEIIDVEAPILNQIRVVTQTSANIHRYCLNLLLFDKPSDLQILTNKIDSARKKNDECLKKIETMSWNQQSVLLLAKLKHTRDTYFRVSESFIQLATTPGKSEALAFKSQNVSPAFEAYQLAQAEFAEHIEKSFEKASDAATSQTKWMQRIVLGLAGAPILIGLGVLLTSALCFIQFIWSVRTAVD